MKRKIFYGIILITAMLLTMGAANKSDELKRMSIFISNFTEAGVYDFDLEQDGDDSITHLGAADSDSRELIYFGIAHNLINNLKTRIKNCPDKNCPYGTKIIDAKFVAESVRKYFDLTLKHASLEGYAEDNESDAPDQAHFDGKNYHFNPANFRNDTNFYADVQNVSRNKGIITMTGEIYPTDNKSVRPATFIATAKPYRFNNKDTWAILSLKLTWKE